MLVVARESRGITQGQLAVASGVPQGTISKAENGLITIAEEKAQALADALHYTRDVLDWDVEVYGFGSSSFYHRKQQSLPQSRLKHIQATFNLARLRTNLLAKGLDIEPSYSFEHFDPDDYDSPEHIARAVRAMWQVPMGPIRDMARLIENAGGVVIRSDFDTHRISAISQWIPGERPIFVSNASMSADRERFSLAHEAAHLLMHERPRETQEKEADEFAAEFLMPSAEIRPQLANGIDLGRAAQLKTYWRVSMSAIIRRARDLECITPRRAKSLYIQMSQQGWLKKEPVEIDRDQTRFLAGVINAQLHQNGYTVQELSRLTGILPDEFTRLYLPEQQARLSLVTKE